MNGNLGGTLLDRFHTVDSVALDALFPSTSRDSVPTNIRSQTMFRERERERSQRLENNLKKKKKKKYF